MAGDDDLLDYIDGLKRKERASEREAFAAKQRQQWRETTYAGYLIHTVERIGAAPFFLAIARSFEGGEGSTSWFLTSLLYKIAMITACVAFVYLLGWIMRQITGDEIVIEKEVRIVEEVTRSQVEAEERAAELTGGGERKRRSKKEN